MAIYGDMLPSPSLHRPSAMADFLSEEELEIPELDHGQRSASLIPQDVCQHLHVMSGRQNTERVIRHSLRGVEDAGKALETAIEAYTLRTQAANDRIRNQNKLNRTATEQLSALEESNREVQAKLAELTELMAVNRRALDTLTDTLAVSKFERNCAGFLRAHPKRELPIERKTKCIICQEHSGNMVIERHCEQRPGRLYCEKRECSCGALVCRECLLHHYWVESNHGRKSYARCPHCRAEFCLQDIVEVRWVTQRKIVRPPKAAEPQQPLSIECTTGVAEAC